MAGLTRRRSQIINTESGSFGRGLRGEIDDAFRCHHGRTPGKYRHEKMISGAYLGTLCLFTAQRAARGRLSLRRRRRAPLTVVHALTTREMNDFLLYPDE